MKRLQHYLLFIFMFFFLWASAQDSPRVKYVFLFIGDGMGQSQIDLTRAYLSAVEGEIGMKPLTFTEFPSFGMVTTFANNSLITESAAAGTAMATGNKTDIDRISMSPDKTKIYKTIAEKAKATGMMVGIITSVSLDHATPASFYSHQPDDKLYFEIGSQLVSSNFDLFAGGGFLEPNKKVNGNEVDLLEKARTNGFFVTNDMQDIKSLMRTRKKIIMMAPRTGYKASLPFAMDAGSSDVRLEDYTYKGIELLDGEEGFFIMIEGGKIDWAGHSNDAGAIIQEVISFDRSVGMALDFYRQHPEETIIVVTADHETGGLSLGERSMGYESNLALFQYQKSSVEKFTLAIKTLRAKNKGKTEEDFAKLLEILEFDLGLNKKENKTLLTEEEKLQLKQMMEQSLYSKKGDKKGDDSESAEPLVALGLQLLAKRAGISWGSYAHTFQSVPVYAIGPGSEEFSGQIDNTDIPKKLEKLMGL